MLKRSTGLGSRRGAEPKRIRSRTRQAKRWGCDLEMRGSRWVDAEPFWLTRGRLFQRYPLVGALLVEIQRSERPARASRFNRY